MFGLKKKKTIDNKSSDMIVDLSDTTKSDSKVFEKGMYSLKDLIAPPSIDRSNEEYIVVGKKYVRNFIMQGFPQQTYVKWLDDLYNYEGEMDVAINIEPADDRLAIETLSVKIGQFESQYEIEKEKGNTRNITKLRDTVEELYIERRKLERNTEKLYQVQIACNLFADSKEQLDKETQKLDNRLRGRKIYMMPSYLKHDEGYKTVLPYGKSYIPDMFRNFNSGALTACFPFYNNEICHETGVFCGVNLSTWTPIMIDFYDKKRLNNSNATVIGQAGSGKTFFVSLLTMRSALRSIHTVIIDPEGEYKKLTDALGGAHISLSPESKDMINVFDIEESDILDDDGYPTGEKEILVKEKCSDILNLIGVMAGSLSSGQKSIVSQLIMDLYSERGITANPNSLFITEPYFDERTKVFYPAGKRKPMPIFSDLFDKIKNYGEKDNNATIIDLANTLKMFKKGGIYDMFDCQTSEHLKDFTSAPIVTFDILQLEEDILRPIGMYVALSWTWEKFVKKNPHIKKRVVCDEAWMLVNKNMKGHEYTANFLETCSRRIRKRNGGLLVASQNFTEFANSIQGQAVIKNAIVNIFLKQDSTDADALRDTFKLSDGEINFLLTAKRGEMLIRVSGESFVSLVVPFEYEKYLIEKQIRTKPQSQNIS